MVVMARITVARALRRMCLDRAEEVQCSSCLGGSNANCRSHCEVERCTNGWPGKESTDSQ